jgi:hypothetical protein
MCICCRRCQVPSTALHVSLLCLKSLDARLLHLWLSSVNSQSEDTIGYLYTYASWELANVMIGSPLHLWNCNRKLGHKGLYSCLHEILCIIIQLYTSIVGSWWDIMAAVTTIHHEGDGLALCVWHLKGHDHSHFCCVGLGLPQLTEWVKCCCAFVLGTGSHLNTLLPAICSSAAVFWSAWRRTALRASMIHWKNVP